jgi:hypothetical protein
MGITVYSSVLTLGRDCERIGDALAYASMLWDAVGERARIVVDGQEVAYRFTSSGEAVQEPFYTP